MNRDSMDIYEFYELGIGDPIAISAGQALGLGDLLDEVISYFPEEIEDEEEEEDAPPPARGDKKRKASPTREAEGSKKGRTLLLDYSTTAADGEEEWLLRAKPLAKS